MVIRVILLAAAHIQGRENSALSALCEVRKTAIHSQNTSLFGRVREQHNSSPPKRATGLSSWRPSTRCIGGLFCNAWIHVSMPVYPSHNFTHEFRIGTGRFRPQATRERCSSDSSASARSRYRSYWRSQNLSLSFWMWVTSSAPPDVVAFEVCDFFPQTLMTTPLRMLRSQNYGVQSGS